MRSAAVKALALAAMLLPAPVLAQAYQCSAPRALAPLRPIKPDGPTRKAPVAGYTLAASWSPDYCKTSGDTRSMQCAKTNGRFGFILHGLWPEAARGPSPQWCGNAGPPSPPTLRQHLCMSPSPDLLAHEWAKHGSCMAPTPEAYFTTGATLWRAIRWPDADRLSRKQDLTAGDLRDEFVATNAGWPREAVAVDLSRSGWLREVRLCYDKNYRPTRCAAGRNGARDGAAMKVWRGL
ncbi:ribonuclease T2 family protein [Novosphingobium sp. Rr 2-17]|uniref:ribonuclease T2 family protein n=1 Tax=Novosphingobium sp. Rr 2-17 TaxID=555793 RepID=UPI0002697BD0|nr:ribonuclease T [Novosphingobium sp. Rr 2-17]EIZ77665.1 ribonuclease T2 family protein [Novosphingobium sp. Rr 2-17]